MKARTHRGALAIAGALWVSALPAAADTPPFLPTTSFSATVFAPGLDGPSGNAEVFHAGHVFRVDAGMPQGGSLTVLIDVPRRTQTVYMDIQGQRIRTAMPWGQPGLAFLTGSLTGTLPVELGPDTVAGEPCTNYIMTDGGVNVCYTSDGRAGDGVGPLPAVISRCRVLRTGRVRQMKRAARGGPKPPFAVMPAPLGATATKGGEPTVRLRHCIRSIQRKRPFSALRNQGGGAKGSAPCTVAAALRG